MKYYARIDGETYAFEFEKRNGRLVARAGDEELEVDFARVRGRCCYSLLVGDDSHQVAFEPRPDGLSVTVGDESYLVQVEDERVRAARQVSKGKGSPDQAKVVLSMMPGIVREVRVTPGDEVAAGDALIILEAMKMENEIRAALDGRVKTVHVEANTTVNKGDPLVTLE
jgi:biotin carboxyl carrier protein